jgi:erythromycin esterase-like protein
MKISLTLLLIHLLAVQAYCQNEEHLINGLNTIIRPITTINSEDSFDDLAFLKYLAKDASIIGIGESTHGTSLYNTYRQRLVRFLVQEMGYKAIIDEGDILAAEKVDAYINHQTDSLQFIGGLRPVLTNKKELDWLRSYNKNRPDSEKVHIYGAEVRGFYGIIQKLKSLFIFNDADIVLERFTGDVGVGYKNLSRKDFEEVKKLANERSTKCSNSLCHYYLSLLNQQIDFAHRQRFGRDDFNVRDEAMFENIKSFVSKTPGNKAIILAHNGHLQKIKLITLTSLGYLLNNFYGNKYFVMATDFNTGDVNIYNDKTGRYENMFFKDVEQKDAIEYYFKLCKHPNFFLPISVASNNTATATLVNNKIKMLRNMGATGVVFKTPVRLVENYDLIIFFNNTNSKEKQ